MNDIEIRALYRELMEPATDPETTNRQRKLAAVAFAHEPYHLDRSAWEPCMLCAVGYWKQIEYSFCPFCGRPLTDMNSSKQRHDGGAYRRYKTMVAAHAKPGKDRSKAGKRKKGKK